MLALSSKYALALYEMVQKRGNLSHQWSETFEVERMRELLGVPTDKLTAYKSFKQRALVPAIDEVNGLSSYGVSFVEVKKGRKVEAITIGWHKKSVEELKEAFSELKRHKVGRRARLSGTDEPIQTAS
jgi:plasmid replication initiation protein